MRHSKLIVIALFAAGSLPAQDARGRILGRVLDPSGAPIPQATITVTEDSTQVKLGATSNEAGAYEVPYLNPGYYTLTASAPGFKSYEHTRIEVRAADRIAVDVTLPVGQVNESVTVSGQTALVDTSTANMGQVTDQRRIVEMPLPGGNSLTLAQFAPGIIYTTTPNHPTLGIGGIDQVSSLAVNGTRNGNVEFTVDGAPSMTGTTVSFSPPTEMVAEVKVQTATYDASVGRVPGGNVNIVLRTGANQLHGSVQWFHTNQHIQGISLFSRQFLYDPTSGPITPAKEAQINPLNIMNRYSATLSGPVVLPKLYDGHNRTFWVFSYEGLSRPQIVAGGQVTVPTAAERAGDFSALLRVGANYQIYDPATIAPAGSGRFSRQPFAGNIIPSSRLDKLAGSFLSDWPDPNQGGNPDGVNNYRALTTQANRQKNLVTKLDHNFNERNRFFVRYNYASQLYIANPLTGSSKTNVPDRLRYTDGAVFDDIHVISPTLLNDFRVGFTRYEQSNTPELAGFDLTGAGFSPTLAASIDPRARQFPTLSVAGYQSIGGAANDDAVTNYLTTSNDLTWNKGPALFRFGGEFRLYRSNSSALLGENPTLNFNSTWTTGPLDNSPASPIGQGFASYLLGIPSGGSINVADSYADQSYNYAFYFQSDWRVTPTLTLNAGVRYDYDGPVTERFNRSVGTFDFTSTNPLAAQALAKYAQNPIPEVPVSQFRVNGGLTFAGVGGQPRAIWEASHLNFAPRVGLAWQFRPDTVFRAGYGIFFVPQGVDRYAVNQNGFTAATTLTPSLDNGLSFVASLANPFPNGLNQALGAEGGLLTGVGQAVSFFPRSLKSAYMQRFSTGFQRQLPARVFLDVSYVGNRGTKLTANRQYDAVPAQYLSRSAVRDNQTNNFLTAAVPNPFYPLPGTGLSGTTVARSQLLRPYPEFTGITASDPVGFSWYHSLQLLSERRFSRGFTAQFNWVWSKFIEATGFLNPTDPEPAQVISDLDRSHVLHATGIYELPFGKGKPFFSTARGVTRALVDGWQLDATWQHNSGAPLGFGNALLVAPVEDIALPSGQSTIAHWFNTAAFDTRSANQLTQNIITLSTRFSGVRAPSVDMWNMSGIKNFSIAETAQIQFRAEFLNALNHTNLNPPNTTPTNSAFGRITAANGFNRVIFFALKLSF